MDPFKETETAISEMVAFRKNLGTTIEMMNDALKTKAKTVRQIGFKPFRPESPPAGLVIKLNVLEDNDESNRIFGCAWQTDIFNEFLAEALNNNFTFIMKEIYKAVEDDFRKWSGICMEELERLKKEIEPYMEDKK